MSNITSLSSQIGNRATITLWKFLGSLKNGGKMTLPFRVKSNGAIITSLKTVKFENKNSYDDLELTVNNRSDNFRIPATKNYIISKNLVDVDNASKKRNILQLDFDALNEYANGETSIGPIKKKIEADLRKIKKLVKTRKKTAEKLERERIKEEKRLEREKRKKNREPKTEKVAKTMMSTPYRDAAHAYALAFAWKQRRSITIDDLKAHIPFIGSISTVKSNVAFSQNVVNHTEWGPSLVYTANLLRKNYSTGYSVYTRDAMDFLYDKAEKLYDKEKNRIMRDASSGKTNAFVQWSPDKWNPADIWIIKTTELYSFKNKINKAKNILTLNYLLMQYLLQNKAIGVSLKKALNKGIRLEQINVKLYQNRYYHKYPIQVSNFTTGKRDKRFTNNQTKAIELKGSGKEIRHGQQNKSTTNLEIYKLSSTPTNTQAAHGALSISKNEVLEQYNIRRAPYDAIASMAKSLASSSSPMRNPYFNEFWRKLRGEDLRQDNVYGNDKQKYLQESAAITNKNQEEGIRSFLVAEHYINQPNAREKINTLFRVLASESKYSGPHMKVD